MNGITCLYIIKSAVTAAASAEDNKKKTTVED